MVELARDPHIQQKLRDELSGYTEDDPTYEELTSGLPYLDAVVNETLRLHPSVPELEREVLILLLSSVAVTHPIECRLQSTMFFLFHDPSRTSTGR
jgi:hypothetical protein